MKGLSYQHAEAKIELNPKATTDENAIYKRSPLFYIIQEWYIAEGHTCTSGDFED